MLRIEDLDTPRVKPGVIDLTIDLLRWLGIDWDEGPLVQSQDLTPTLRAMHILAERGHVYPCSLTRREIEAASSAPQEGAHDVPYPRSLRPAHLPGRFTDDSTSWRFATPDARVHFPDAFAGEQSFDVGAIVGDFVVWTRRDPGRPGQPAYQLAVVVDDHRQGITHVVRGDDLLDSGARQLLLYRALGLTPEPVYTHLPLVVGEDGRRLAKRHGDTRLDVYRAAGVPPERVIGLAAYWSGLSHDRRPLSAADFLDRFDLRRMPRQAAVFTREDDQWLRA